nr:hypothetical protein [uncultured Methanobrevibacter sp.]
MATYVKKGDRLKGEQIQCEARKISNPIPVPKSGRHKTQQIILKNNVECEIKKESKHLNPKQEK